MEENKNTEVEVMTEDFGSAASECGLEVTNLEPSAGGPSKGFVALAVGAVAAVVVGATVAIKRHKKKKADAKAEVEDFDEEYDDYEDYDEDLDEVDEPETTAEEKSKEDSKKKG